MEKEFVPYKLAVKLKALGFDEPCFGYYEPNGELGYIENHILKDFPYLAKNSEWQDLVAAPTFSHAFRWFRERLKDSAIEPYSMVTHISYNRKITFEEAELACLDKLLEIVESKSE